MDPRHLLIFLVSVGVRVTVAIQDEDVSVNTVYGTVTGKRRAYDYPIEDSVNTVDAYLGIPYAESPVGHLRFKDPITKRIHATGVRHDGTKYGPICTQEKADGYYIVKEANLIGEEKSEDCLRLNIYTPYKAGSDETYPVMVWIHGGSLLIGSGNWFDGHVLAQHGVVVVTINYRLGPLGFLSDGDRNSKIPGDYGIYDQVKALQWIQKNIRSFRGNPSEVTIFGNSAGGWSVNLHLMMPESKGLFHRAIVQSGPLEGRAFHYSSGEEKNEMFQKVAKSSGCTGDSNAMVACLRQKQATEFTTNDAVESPEYKTLWKGSRVLPDDTATILRTRPINKVPVMIGVTADEAARFLGIFSMFGIFNFSTDGRYIGNNAAGPVTDKALGNLVRTFFSNFEHMEVSSETTRRVVAEYFPSNIRSDRRKVTGALSEMASDVLMNVPSLRIAKLLNNRGVKSYFYIFDNPLSMNVAGQEKLKWLSKYCYHESELPFLFGMPVSGGYSKSVWHLNDYSSEEKELSLSMMRMWTDFAKHGNPTPKGADVPWEHFDSSGLKYMNFKASGLKLETKPWPGKVKFWEDVLPQMFIK